MGLYRVDFRAHVDGVDIVNVFHVVTHDTPALEDDPDPTPTEVADEVNSQLQAAYITGLGTNATLDEIAVTTVVDPNNPAEVPSGGSHVLGIAGTRALADQHLPPALCGHITWRTALNGRSFRGRSYMWPIESTNQIIANQIVTSGLYDAAMDDFAEKVVDANLGGGSSWSSLWIDTWAGKFVVYSPTRHKGVGGVALEPYYADITAAVVRPDVGELRSRRR